MPDCQYTLPAVLLTDAPDCSPSNIRQISLPPGHSVYQLCLLYTSSTFKKTVKEDYEEVFDELELPKFTKYLAENADIVNLGIILMLVTGIRVGELAALKWDDYDGNGLKDVYKRQLLPPVHVQSCTNYQRADK